MPMPIITPIPMPVLMPTPVPIHMPMPTPVPIHMPMPTPIPTPTTYDYTYINTYAYALCSKFYRERSVQPLYIRLCNDPSQEFPLYAV
jgi:hypothetical protein